MKKLFVSLLCVVMMVTFMPSMAFADAGAGDTAGSISPTPTNNTLTEPSYTVTGMVTLESGLSIPEGKTVTIHLSEGSVLKTKVGHTITNEGTLTVTGAGKIENSVAGKGALYNAPNGTAFLNGGTFEDSNWYVIKNLGNLTIDGATVNQKDSGSSNIANGYYGNKGNDCGEEADGDEKVFLEIKNGTFSGGMNTVKNDDYGILVIQNGTFTNTAGPAVMNWNEATINDGIFSVSNNASSVIANGYLNETHNKGQLTINGGTFTAANNGNGSLFGYNSGTKKGGNFVITSGAFNGTVAISEAYPYKPEITGGTFSEDVSDYLPSGMEQDDKGNIIVKDTAVAKVGTVFYATLEDAIVAAGNELSTITLLKDTSENITIPETANIVLDLNGNVLSGGTATRKAAVTNNGTLTIKDSKGNGGTIKREDNGAQGYYTIDNQGTMTIESGRIENKTGPMPNGSSLIRNAGNGKEAVLNINGGEIYQNGFIAVKNDDQGFLNITGGKISTSGDTATNTASAVQNWSKAVISGGEINGTVWTGTWSKDFPDSKTEIRENAVINGQITARVEGNGAGEKKPVVEISGGTLNVPKWSVGKDGSTVSITGGKLNYGDGTVMNYISDTADKKVTIVLKENTKITSEKAGEVVFEAPAGVKVENGTSNVTITVTTPSGTFEVEPNKDITSQNPYIPPTTPVQKPTIEAEEGATVTLSKDGTTATIVVDKDATLKDVLLNGKSLGTVTEVPNLKTGDKLVVIVETAAEKNARIKAGVENTTIKMYYNKKEIGKGWIKLRYKKSYGYKVDNYEIFRSAKKKTNFGDEAWFVTKTNKTKGYYKNGKSVKKGTRYYYKMRGVREIAGETVYTQWSNIVMRTGR